jgi:hypothetical protein
VVATLVACAVMMASLGLYNIATAHAANLTNVSDTLTDSDISTVSNQTIAFTIPAGSSGVAASGGTITVTFPAGFNMGSVAFGDLDLKVGGTDQTLAAAPAAGVWGAVKSGQVITFTTGSGVSAAAGQAIEIQIGTNATFGTTGTNQITNPTAGSYELYITAGTADTGRTRVAILSHVTVTAIVDTTFTFTVTGMATSTPVNGLTTTGSTSPTKIAFGHLVAGTPKVLSQRLNVTTNAKSGFIVTVYQDNNLQSSTGADIDGFKDGAYTNTPAAWASPTNNIANENTWGHWGLTSSDDINTSEFASSKFVAASTTPRQIFSHTGPADGTTANIGSTTVGYKIEITPLQEAADDYTTVLTYIATPTF